jgi:hypothetical protein
MFGKTPSYMDVVLPSQIRSPLRNSWLRPVSIPTLRASEPRQEPQLAGRVQTTGGTDAELGSATYPIHSTPLASGVDEAGRHGEFAIAPRQLRTTPVDEWFLGQLGRHLGVVSLPAAEGEATAPRRNGEG